jgi:hypothetical protein
VTRKTGENGEGANANNPVGADLAGSCQRQLFPFDFFYFGDFASGIEEIWEK